jgi:hypothetical protein
MEEREREFVESPFTIWLFEIGGINPICHVREMIEFSDMMNAFSTLRRGSCAQLKNIFSVLINNVS